MESTTTPPQEASATDHEHADKTPTTERARGGFRGFFEELFEDLRENNSGPTFTREDLFTLIIISVLLTIFYYFGRPAYFRRHHWDAAGALLGWDRSHEYFRLIPYYYWAVASVFFRMMLPCLIVVLVYRERIRDYGYRLIGEVEHARIYLLLYFIMLPIVVFVSFQPSFQGKYPFYKGSMDGLDHFVMYQLCYGIQFIALEAFFRGFMIFALFKRFGYYSVVIMTIPYCMIHFGKPMPETLGAIVAGLALGYLALKSKSWLYGALLHWSVGITMDLLAIYHKGGFKG